MARPGFSSTRLDPKRLYWLLRRFVRWQREAPPSTPLSRRLEGWRGGYHPTSYALYDLSPEYAHEYLPDAVRLRVPTSTTAASTFFVNGSFARAVLDDKLLFTSLFSSQLPIPRILALIEQGKTFAREQGAGEHDLLSLAERNGSVVLKPSDGSRGRGIYRLDREGLTLNGRAAIPKEVRKLVKTLDNYLVTETVQQATYAKAICPDTTNTVRIVTLIEPDTHEPFIARAVHRFGTRETRPTDNWSRGGLSAAVDLRTGVLGPGVKHAKRTGGRLEWKSHHPDTGEAIEGVRVPHWKEVCSALVEAVRNSPFLNYVGWDVVLTDDGFVTIEGNKNTDTDLLQVHGGLLKDPRIRRFYEHHGVIQQQ